MKNFSIALTPTLELGGSAFPVIAGPCVVENEEVTFEIADRLVQIGERLALDLIFKASFDKANRSSLESFRSIGHDAALAILGKVKDRYGLPLLTDVHEPGQCAAAAEICDVLQIPAFLCRQTDLILAAAETGRAVNIKKGQFVAPGDIRRAVDKARSTGNDDVCVTERGYSFGYNNLVVDMRSFHILHQDGIPVIFDITHSLQLPGGDVQTGGAPEFAEPLASAAVAAGADGIFIETHPRPARALSDSTTQLPPERAEALISRLLAIRRVTLAADSAPGETEDSNR